MTLFDVLALVCGLCMVLKMPKRVYKALGLALVVSVLWSSASCRTLRSKASALTMSAPIEWSQGELQQLIILEADAQGVDPAIALLFSELESTHRNVTGDNGNAYGPLQVTAHYHIPHGDPNDPRVSVRAGVGVIADKLDRYDGNITKARLAYVCGTAQGCSRLKTRKVINRLEHTAPGYGLSL